ncbi:MAG: head-tail adaptor, partial [Desulfovibrio sp.]|nr:head-tail adaptor [Desulfovibrio sp.]
MKKRTPKPASAEPTPGQHNAGRRVQCVEDVLSRLSGMEAARAHWLPLWVELASQIMPRKSPALGLRQGGQPGPGTDEAVFDSTPAHSLELLASALGGLLTNPALPWLDLRLGRAAPDDEAVRSFLAECRERLLSVFNTEATGFQTCVHELYLDLCLFGTAVMHVEADPDCVVRFSARPMGEVYLAEDARGVVDTVIRRYCLTARQVWQQWGQACSADVIRQAEDNPEERVEILHAVFPRPGRDPASPASRHFPLASLYVEASSRQLLEESGYLEMPYMCPRWAKAPGEAY